MTFVIFVVLLAAALIATGCAQQEPAKAPTTTTETAVAPTPAPALTPEAADEAATILEQQCTLCHSLNRIYLLPSTTDWAAVIDRMDVNHAKAFPNGIAQILTPGQREAIIEFMKSRTASAGELVVKAQCATCHALTNLTTQAQGTDWSAIIKRMIAKYGASLTVTDQQNAVNFLNGQQ